MNAPTDADALLPEVLLLRRLILLQAQRLPTILIGRQSVADIGLALGRGHRGRSTGKDILRRGKIKRRGGIGIGARNGPLPGRDVRGAKRRATGTR
jgi:hypothetical protein